MTEARKAELIEEQAKKFARARDTLTSILALRSSIRDTVLLSLSSKPIIEERLAAQANTVVEHSPSPVKQSRSRSSPVPLSRCRPSQKSQSGRISVKDYTELA